MKVKCHAQEHNTMTQPGLKPRILNPELSLLTIRSVALLCSGYKNKEHLFFSRNKTSHSIVLPAQLGHRSISDCSPPPPHLSLSFQNISFIPIHIPHWK